MLGESAAVVRAQFEATNRREWAGAMAAYADDVELVVPDSMFSSGTYRGREHVGEWFGDWFRTFAGGFHFDILEIREGGDRVALWARHTARGGHSGVEVVADFFYEYRVNDGTIVSLRFCQTWAEALQIVAPRR